MKGNTFFSLMILSGVLGASGQVIAPDNKGDIFRAEAMLADDNYLGIIHQLDLLDMKELSDADAMQVLWLRCRALAHIDKKQALATIDEFLQKYPSSELFVNALVLKGDCLLESSPEDALGVYAAADESALPEGARAALDYHKGYALLQLGRLDEAQSFFAGASRDSRWRKKADFYRGYMAYVQGDYSSAKRFFEVADQSVLPGAMSSYYLAQIYFAEGDFKKALAAARALTSRSDVDDEFAAEATRIAGESLYQLGDTKEGIRLLRQYLASTSAPERSALYIVGATDFNDGKIDEAAALLERVVAGNHCDALAQSSYLFIGQAKMARGDRNAALIAFDNALKMDADLDVQEAAFYNYAVAKSTGAKMPFGSSAETFEEFLRRYPNGKYSESVQEYLAQGYLADGDYSGALASINRMQNPSPKVLETKQKALYALGTRSLAMGDADNAVKYLREAQSMKEGDGAMKARVALSLGEALYRKGEYSKAIRQFDRYFASAPADDANRPLARYDVGYAFFAIKDYSQAAKNFSQFIASPGGFVADIVADANNRLADSWLYLGDLDKAAKSYEKAYSLKPASGDYPLFQMAVIEGFERKHSKKIESMQRLLDRFPQSSLAPDALLEMTESYIQLGDRESAIATYRRLVSEYPSTEQGRKGYVQMALTLQNSGRKNEAVAAYKDVVTLYPTSEEARIALDELKQIAADDGMLPQLSAWLSSVDNAPAIDVAEADRLSYDSAEKAWIVDKDAARFERYLTDFPHGSYRPNVLGYLTEIAYARGNYIDAVDYASEIVEKYPDSSQAEKALLYLASAQYDLGDSEAALKSWTDLEQRASSSNTLNTARTGIMRSARDAGLHQRVIDAADALLTSSDVGGELLSEARFSRAYALASSGHPDEAVPVWMELAVAPNDLNGAKSACYLAEYYLENGSLGEARAAVEGLVNSGTPHSYWLARGFILLSDIYAREGKVFEAREYLKSLRDNYPGNETDIFNMIESRLEKLSDRK